MSTYPIPYVTTRTPLCERTVDVYSRLLADRIIYLGTGIDDAEKLLTFCSGRLAKYKIPKRVEFVEALPYSPYGKVIKAEL